MEQEVIMDFDDNDNPIISVRGVRGKVCKDITAGLEQKLGKVVKEEKTKEYYQTEEKQVGRVRHSGR